MFKKILITTAIVLIITTASLAGYYFLVKNNNGDGTTGNNVFKNFFPFGVNDTPVVETPQQNENEQEETPPTPTISFGQKLRKITSEPVAGGGILDSKAGSVIRYIERSTGHIYETELFSPKTIRLSNTTMPLIYEAFWGNNNTSLLARHLKDDSQTIDTYTVTLKSLSTSTENSVGVVAFPGNISAVSVYGGNIFYLVRGEKDSSGYLTDFTGQKRKLVWNSPIKELNAQLVNAKNVALNTKPVDGIPGFLYLVNTDTGAVRKILGDVLGLSSLVNPEANKILYLLQGGIISMNIFDDKTKTTTNLTPSTFPEKCVWSIQNKNILYCAVSKEPIYPNSLTLWYKGLSSFSDDIWKYDLQANTSSIVADLSEGSGQSIDVINPILSTNEQYLIFINKKDNSLWSLDLTK